MNGLLESLTGLRLADPWLLLLALAVPAVLHLSRRRGRASIAFASASLLGREPGVPGGDDGLPRTWRVRVLPALRLLQVAGVLLAVVALARPVRRDRLPLETQGIDIVLALDASSSMTTADMGGGRTRLDAAKDAAARFVADRPHDRIGLVVFARFPDLRCPPTLDHDALRTILAETAAVEGDGPEDATGIGTAVARAAEVLRGTSSPSKVVVLLTDGAENVASASKPREIAPIHAAQLCETLGVRVHAVVAAGDADGAANAPRADPQQVRRVAERTGGRFFEARDATALAQVYAAIDRLEKTTLAEPRYRVEERFLPFLAGAVTLLLGAAVLRATVLDVLP